MDNKERIENDDNFRSAVENTKNFISNEDSIYAEMLIDDLI